MNAKHTLGPWDYWRASIDGGIAAAVNDQNGYCVAIRPDWSGLSDGEHEDMRLIAAAPDLLAACTDWIDWLDTCDDLTDAQAATREEAMLASMRAAIAKAGAA